MTLEKRLQNGKRVVSFKPSMDLLNKGFKPISPPAIMKSRGRISQDKKGR